MTNFRGVAQDDSERVYLLYCRTSDNTAVVALHSNNISLSAKKVQYRNPERVIQYFLKDGFTSGPVTIPYFDVHTKM